jgi:D-glycero-D-manno-heptose 1,7-bisphosphate phosphatase
MSERDGARASRRAIFLDRDGVLNADVAYPHRRDQLVLLPGVARATRALHDAGYLLLVVSNQSGVARGMFGAEAVAAFNAMLDAEIVAAGGASIARYYFCPHHPRGSVPELTRACACRKPAPGMVLQGLTEFDLDAARCWMVGDKADDVACAAAAGVAAVQLARAGQARHPAARAMFASLEEALPLLLTPPA